MDASTWQIISFAGYSLAIVLFAAAVFMFFRMNILAVIGDLSGRTASRQIQEIRDSNIAKYDRTRKPDLAASSKGKKGRWGKTAQALAHPSKMLDRTGRTVETKPPTTPNGSGIWSKKTDILPDETERLIQATEVLVDGTEGLSPATEVLVDGTEGLSPGTEVLVNGTEVLSPGTEVLVDGTEVLSPATQVPANGTEVLVHGTEVLAGGFRVQGDDYGTQVLSDRNGTTVLYPTADLEDEPNSPAVEFKIIKDVKAIHTNEVI